MSSEVESSPESKQLARPLIGTSPRAYFPAAGHEEALARLLYLAEFGRAGGLMIGPRGIGKSLVLSEAAQELRTGQRSVILIDMADLDAADICDRLLTAARIPKISGESATQAESRLRDFIQGQQLVGTPIVFLLDNLDMAAPGGFRAMDRVLRLADPTLGSVTVLATATDAVEALSLDWIASHGELRIDLPALEPSELAGYLSSFTTGIDQAVSFHNEAIQYIDQLSQRIPREIDRVARLALLAAMADEREEVTRDLVGNVVTELPSATRSAHLASA